MCPPEKPIVRLVRELVNDVDSLKLKVHFVEQVLGVHFFLSNEDMKWKARLKDGTVQSLDLPYNPENIKENVK